MFTDIIEALGTAFGQVTTLLTEVLGDAFTAVAQLSSGIFGGEGAE